MVGMKYDVAFDPEKTVYINTRPFDEAGIPHLVL